jgi:hypothetical protein
LQCHAAIDITNKVTVLLKRVFCSILILVSLYFHLSSNCP